MSQHTKARGFTLIELVIYIALLGIIVLSVGEVLLFVRKVEVKQQVVSEVEHQGYFAAETMSSALRNSASITSPTLGASGASLTLATSSGGTNPTVFDLSAGALRASYAGAAAQALTSPKVTASGLTFTNLGRASTSGVVRGQFTLTYVVTGTNKYEYSYAKTFYFSAGPRQ